MLLPPNAPIATDRKPIRESWAGLLGPQTAVSHKVSRVEVAKSGELGYLFGTYSLEIWKKQVDGKWKCIVDTYNLDLPAGPTLEAKK